MTYHKDRKKFAFICFSLLMAELIAYLTLFKTFGTFYIPDGEINPASHIVYLNTITHFFSICNGLIGSIALALFISRLIGSHTTVFRLKEVVILPVLFLYCAIQPLYIFVASDEKTFISSCVLIIALLCKFLLYYLVVSMFDSKKILFHFIESMSIKENVSEKINHFERIWAIKEKRKKIKR